MHLADALPRLFKPHIVRWVPLTTADHLAQVIQPIRVVFMAHLDGPRLLGPEPQDSLEEPNDPDVTDIRVQIGQVERDNVVHVIATERPVRFELFHHGIGEGRDVAQPEYLFVKLKGCAVERR